MPQRPLEHLTFREKIRDCAHRTRELIEHIDQNLLKQVHEAHKKTRPPRAGQEDDLTDMSVRHLVLSVLESRRYAEQFEDQIDAFGRAIEEELQNILRPPAG